MRHALPTAVAVVCSLAPACNRTLTVYERTSPRRIEVNKRASPPRLSASATRFGNETEIRLKRGQSVRIARIVHYNSSAIIYGHSMNPVNELGEMILGLLLLTVPTGFWQMGERLDGRETERRKVVRHQRMLFSLLDPTHSVFTNNIRTEPVVEKQVFTDPARVRTFEMRLPAAAAEFRYLAFSEAETLVAEGALQTDVHGAAWVTLPAEAVVLKVEHDGEAVMVPILEGTRGAQFARDPGGERGLFSVREEPEAMAEEGEADAASEPDSYAEALAAASARSVEVPEPEVVTEVSDGDDRTPGDWQPRQEPPPPIPHLSVLINIAPWVAPESTTYVHSEGMFDVPLLHPKLSFTAIVGWGQFPIAEVEVEGFDEVGATGWLGGAQLRFYALGNARTGLHLAAEGIYTTYRYFRDPRIDLAPVVGYKHTLDLGFTAELQAGWAYTVAPEVLSETHQLSLNGSIGWAF